MRTPGGNRADADKRTKDATIVAPHCVSGKALDRMRASAKVGDFEVNPIVIDGELLYILTQWELTRVVRTPQEMRNWFEAEDDMPKDVEATKGPNLPATADARQPVGRVARPRGSDGQFLCNVGARFVGAGFVMKRTPHAGWLVCKGNKCKHCPGHSELYAYARQLGLA